MSDRNRIAGQLLAATLLALPLIVSASTSAATTSSQVFIGQGDGSFVDTQPLLQSQVAGQPVEATNTITHQTPNGPLVWNAAVSATSNYQSLKSSTSASISNTYFDPNYTFQSNGTQSGVPTHYDTYSRARFTETLQYGGTATNYTSTYLLNLSGRIVRDGLPDTDDDGFFRGPQVTVRLIHANEPAQVWSIREEGDFNLPLVSHAYVHGAAPQTFFLEIITNTAWRMESLSNGSTVSGAAEFGNTLTLTGVDLRDATTGAFLANETITTDAGGTIPVVMVPEPATLGLAAAGAMIILRRRAAIRRRN